MTNHLNGVSLALALVALTCMSSARVMQWRLERRDVQRLEKHMSTLHAEHRKAVQAEHVARLFHETYERLAPEFGYETRTASAVPWADVPDQNKRLMIAVAGAVLTDLKWDAYRTVADRAARVYDEVEDAYAGAVLFDLGQALDALKSEQKDDETR